MFEIGFNDNGQVAVTGRLDAAQAVKAQEFLDVNSYTHVKRWAETIEARPAVQRGRKVNRAWGPEEEQVLERHSAADLD